MPVRKKPEGLEDYEALHTDGKNARIIIDIIHLSAGLNMAVDQINPGKITKAARAAVTQLIAQSYQLFVNRIALELLQEAGKVGKDTAVSDVSIRFDLPDDEHNDLVIYYKFQL